MNTDNTLEDNVLMYAPKGRAPPTETANQPAVTASVSQPKHPPSPVLEIPNVRSFRWADMEEDDF
tara:strand:+ start:132 stop:326 length:195 start_codon:yes stop_codon:yes gene_type:complete